MSDDEKLNAAASVFDGVIEKWYDEQLAGMTPAKWAMMKAGATTLWEGALKRFEKSLRKKSLRKQKRRRLKRSQG